ncbi:hypothetical protein NL676_002267 [Syzygium grande]|nr:hypothetical protein NL676_002267 [Syzygium grande]
MLKQDLVLFGRFLAEIESSVHVVFDGGIPMIFSIPDVGRLVVTHDLTAAVVVLFGFDHGRNPRPVASKLAGEWRPMWGPGHRPEVVPRRRWSGVPPGRDRRCGRLHQSPASGKEGRALSGL